MYNKKMYQLGTNPSAIRDLFEYGKKRKQPRRSWIGKI